MNINLKQKNIDNIINEYNLDPINNELEIVLNKKNINEEILNKIILFLLSKYNKLFNTNLNINNIEIEYILDIFIDNISKNHRLTLKDKKNILKEHCENEYNNINTLSFPDNYKLEYKKLINKYIIDDLNCKINLKQEYIETDKNIIQDFYQNYNKFQKFYRFKKRYTLNFNSFKIDISIIKQNTHYNLILSKLLEELDSIEIEIEIIDKNVNLELIIKILKEYIILFKQISTNGYFVIDEIKKKNIKTKYYNLLKKFSYKNIGPKAITLTKKTIHNMLLESYISESKIKSSNDLLYKITEKADGERYFMYIDNEGIIYLINHNDNLILTGLKLNINNKEHLKYINSILDGEYLYYTKNGKKIYEYKYFDIYISNNVKVYNTLLKNRISLMNNLDLILNSDDIIKYINNDIYIQCLKKTYYDLNKFNELIKKDYLYNIDGIIFMPTINLYTINNITFKEILKYKPIRENTIDVYVNKNILYCGFNILKNKNKEYILSELMSIKPYILDLHKPDYIYYNNNINKEVPWNLLNKKVIEIRYDNDSNKLLFLNIRYDKTIKYNNTNLITANNFNIINDIMSYNFNPLDEKEMSNLTINYINTINNLNNNNNYYKLNNNINHKNNIRTINNEIKRQQINYSIEILEFLKEKLPNDFNFIKVLDLACGRGGDLKKFIDTNFNNNQLKKDNTVQFYLGIDNDYNNIEYYDDKISNNNARSRYITYRNTYIKLNNNSNIPYIYDNNSVYFITGNINLYADYDYNNSTYDNYIKLINKQYLDFPDRSKYDIKLLNDIKNKFNNIFNLYEKEQFELINCQFAIHYFNIKHFAHFINKNLKDKGLFICSFMNIEFVHNLMQDKNQIDGNFWSLKKSDNPNTILVKFNTLEDDYKEELLVDKNDIINEFSIYSIKPYEDTSIKYSSDRNYNIQGIFDFKNYYKLIYNNDYELQFSKLYTYIIFQKNNNIEQTLKNII